MEMITVKKDDLKNVGIMIKLLKYDKFLIKGSSYTREVLEYIMCDMGREMLDKMIKVLGFKKGYLKRIEEYNLLAYMNMYKLEPEVKKVGKVCDVMIDELIPENYDGSREFLDVLIYVIWGVKIIKYDKISDVSKIHPKNVWQISKSMGNLKIPPYIFLEITKRDKRIEKCCHINEDNLEQYKRDNGVVEPVFFNRDRVRFVIDCIIKNNSGVSMVEMCKKNKPDEIWCTYDDFCKLVGGKISDNKWEINGGCIYKDGNKCELDKIKEEEDYTNLYGLYRLVENEKDMNDFKNEISKVIVNKCFVK